MCFKDKIGRTRARIYVALGLVLLVAGCVTTSQRLTDEEVQALVANFNLEQSEYGDEGLDWGIAPTADLRKDKFHAWTPKAIPGASVLRTTDLLQKLQAPAPPILIDVVGGQNRESLPGAVWLKGAGVAGTYETKNIQRRYEAKLAALTDGDKSKPIVIFCLSSECWLSYNGALRAVQAGYTNIAWYRGGTVAWAAAGLPMTTVSEDRW